MALFPSDISEFNFKRNAAKAAVVTRTFFRHLNIVVLKVCRVDNTCIIFVLSKADFIFRNKLLHFHWLTIHFRKSDQATPIRGAFEFYNLCGRAVYFSSPPLPPPPAFSPQFFQSVANGGMAAKHSKDEKDQNRRNAG